MSDRSPRRTPSRFPTCRSARPRRQHLPTGAQLAFAFTTVRFSVRGRPGLPSVISRRKKAALLNIPVRSGYGPAVSSGVTTHAAGLVPVVVSAVASERVDTDGATGDELQPAANAAPAAPSSSSTCLLE